MTAMNDTSTNPDLRDDAVLACEVSDETLEAAAGATPQAQAANSMAPTAVFLVFCCTNG